MSNVLESDDPLLRLIAELRVDVNQLIDEQVAYVKDRVEEQEPPRPLRLAPVPSVMSPPPPDEPAPAPAREVDPRQRLEALAKHLDHRLRQANAAVADRKDRGPTSES